MVGQTHNVDALLALARSDPDRLGGLLQHYRPYLNLIASQRIDPRIVRRVCETDLVQEALAEAAARFGQFRGETEAELTAWLQMILSHTLEDAVRVHVVAQKRAVARERPLYIHDGSASFVWYEFAAPDSTPSKQLVRGEKALRLAQLIESLPGKQGEVIRLRFFQGLKVRQIAVTMELTPSAVAGLLKRGLRTLRSSMYEGSWFSDALTSQR